jgi:glycosyltransferase involved in cell wall biosynthesis
VAILDVAAVLRARRPDLIAAQEGHGLGLLALARGLAGSEVPLVCHRRVDVAVGGWFGSRWKFRQAELFVCVSGAVARILEGCGIPAERIRVVYSGTPGYEHVADARDSVRAELGIDGAAGLLGTVAGLIPHKGHGALLEAFAQVAPVIGGLHLLLVGQGPLREGLQARAELLGIAGRTHFLGERSDIGRLLSAMDLFVLPSLTEGLGSVILDAFSVGLPVVATNAGGIGEIVREGETGRLAVAGDPGSLANVILQALEDHMATLKMAATARERFSERYTDRVMAAETLACYRTVVAG